MNWQPIETAPKDGRWFLTYMPGLSDPFSRYDFASFSSDVQDFVKIGCGYDFVTHWADLTPPGAEAVEMRGEPYTFIPVEGQETS